MANSPVKLPQINPWLWAFVAVVTGVVLAQIYGRGAFFLMTGGAVLVGAILILWNSLLALTGDAPLTLDEALSLAAPSAEEERKESVLRALKDLEYERNVGKLSEDDYRELSRRYRQDAKRLLQLVDDNLAPARARALHLLEERLKDVPHPMPAPSTAASTAPAASEEPANEAHSAAPAASEEPANEASDAMTDVAAEPQSEKKA